MIPRLRRPSRGARPGAVIAAALAAVIVSLSAGSAATSACGGDYRRQIISYEVGGCGWSERCYARNRHSTALGCYQLTRAALVDAGLKRRDGTWLPNRWGISTDREFAASMSAQDHAFDIYTAQNWRALGPARSLVGREIGGARVTEGGLLAAAHFLGVGGMRDFAACGMRPDCISDEAAQANGGRGNAWRIAMNRLAAGGAADGGIYAGRRTLGGGGSFDGFAARGPAAPEGAFLPWTAASEDERPPLQGERGFLRGSGSR